jgi:hypothetical protein
MPTKKQIAERDEARATLRELIDTSQKRRDGSPVIYTFLRHVSKSGMSRDITLKIVDKDGTLRDITYTAALALSEKPRDNYGRRVIRVHGCGMDMGFHVVYALSWALYATGDLATDNANRVGYQISHEWA